MLDWLLTPSCPCDPAAKGWVEERPGWARHPTGGARADLKQGLRYLHATGDSACRPARMRPGGCR